jgi:hypothetical protein
MWIVGIVGGVILLTLAWYVFNALAHGADKAGNIVFARHRQKRTQHERELWSRYAETHPEE